MSLAGKILAVINILGAIGLVYLASGDYATRQAWAYSVFRQDLQINGLPVDEPQQSDDGEPILPRISEEDKTALLSGVGPALMTPTQVAEVRRVKGELDAKIDGVNQDPLAQTYLLARILLPLSDAYHEREQLLACRAYFANKEAADAFRTRLSDAFKKALGPTPAGLPEKPLSEAFRQEVAKVGGEPADLFVSQLLRGIPDDRAKAKAINFDVVWQSTVATQADSLKRQLDRLVDEALGQTNEATGALKPLGLDGQRTAIARLLFGLCPFLAEEAIYADSSKEQEKATLDAAIKVTFGTGQEALLSTPTFAAALKRVLIVCGLKSTMGAISERASVVRLLTNSVQQAMTAERQQFVYDDLSMIELIREQASLVRDEQSVINENRDRLAGYDTVVRERKKEIGLLQDDFKKMRADNLERTKKLRDLSQQVLDLRVRIRDAITANEKGEQRIRDLERQAAGSGKSSESVPGKSIEK